MMKKRRRIRRKRTPLLVFLGAVLVPAAMALLAVTVFARTTYMITDGSRILVHTTAATDPELVLHEVGLELGRHDTYTTQEGTGLARIHVRRMRRVNVNYCGKKIEALSPGETVSQLLERLQLEVQEGDTVSAPLEAQVYDGMELTVGQLIRENQRYTTVLPHETIRCTDATLPEGVEKVVTQGQDGQLLCEAAVTYLNGVETGRKVLNKQVVTQPVREVLAVGTGPRESGEEETEGAVIGSNTITLPTGEVLTYIEKVDCLATAYCCEGYVGTTATGTRARVGAIAVDPEVFPYGTRFYIQSRDGEYIYGVATAEDCGDKRFIYGTRLDLYFDTKRECIQFGARSCDVYVLG